MDNNYNLNDNGQDSENVNISEERENINTPVVSESQAVKPKSKSSFKVYLSLVLISSIVSSTAIGGALYTKFSDDLKKQTELIQKTAIVATTNKTTSTNTDKTGLVNTALTKGSTVTEIAKKVGPSIVGIRMTVGNPQNRNFGEDSAQSKAEGSGVIISKDGYIMTNYHVVSYADPKGGTSKNTTLEVFLPDKRQAKAKFIGGDSKNDLAVIKVEFDNLPVAELGDSSQIEVGELAVAIGNPLGMEFAGSVTAGVVSAVNRKVETDDKTMSLIQTDAAINPGNSGGALVNSQGQVIGINSIKISQQGIEGLGFAIPMNDAKPIVDQLIMFGYVKGRPLIGISSKEITEVIAKQYNLPVGVYVISVEPGSGADKAGIKKSDIIVGMDNKDVKTAQDLDSVKKEHKSGDTVNVSIVRDGNKVSLKLTFSEEH